MRSKNARPIDADEAAWLADVKSVPCVFCDKPPPVEGHHVKQGRHYCAVAACKACHDARVWHVGKMTEFDAINETVRRVVRLRAGVAQKPQPVFRLRGKTQRGDAVLSKIVPRRQT